MTVLEKCDGICVNCTKDVCVKARPYLVEDENILHRFTPDKAREGYGIVFDLGTTTLVAGLVDLQNGQEIRRVTALNPQRRHGHDVLSRITYVQRNGGQGSRTLQEELLAEMSQMIRALKVQEVNRIAVAANCIMTHLLLDEDVTGLGLAPYRPVFLEAQLRTAGELGLPVRKEVPVYCLPNISAYIGGDISGGIMACELPENSLYLDIGTNGEMVLRTENGYYACSCAVGPALEGMNISCGMTASEGAIDDVWFKDGRVQFHVLGDVEPVGLCGSGILTAIRALLQGNVIDEDGGFAGEKDSYELCADVVMTWQDIRQVQLSKGAILSGVKCLLAYAGVQMESVEHIYIAGQFGQHIFEDIFTDIGLLPKGMQGDIRYVGNGALAGAHKALISEAFCREAEAICHKVTYLELANTDEYMQIFIDSLSFK